MTRKFARISAIGILIALVVSGLSFPSSRATTPSDAFVYGGIGEPQYLDPAVDWESNGMNIIENVYQTLIWYDGSSPSSFVPVLATEVPTLENGLISADGLSYTVHIRPGVTFHDGSALTADDVTYSIQRVLRIHDYSGPSWMLEQVLTDYVSYWIGLSVSDYLAASYQAPWITAILEPLGMDHIITEEDSQAIAEAAVLKVDDMTVTFRLTHSYAGFVSILAATVSSIVSKDFVEANGGIVNGQQNAAMNQNMCGSGPYKFVSWEYGVQIHLARNDAYWGTLAPLKDVYVISGTDEATMIMMLKTGDADSAYVPINNESEFLGNQDFTVTKGLPTFEVDAVGFNMNINTSVAALYGSNVPADFFMNKNVRKAFVHLMDCGSLINSDVLKGNALQPNGPIPLGMFGYDPSTPRYDYNLTLAADYLQAALNPETGNSWWTDGFTIAMMYNAGNLMRETAAILLKQAIEQLNAMPGTHGTFNAVIVALDWPTYLANLVMRPSPLPMFFVGWAPDYSDPDDYAVPFLGPGQYFPWRTEYSNATIAALVALAAMEMDPTLREGMYKEISALVYDDAPYIWLYQPENFQVMRSWVDGYYFNPMLNGLYYASLSKTQGPSGTLVTKMQGSPAASAVSWTFEPASPGNWTLVIENNGLTKLTIEIRDLATGEKVSKQTITFAKVDAYPTGTATSAQVPLMAGHIYDITVTPNGRTGGSALVFEHFAT